MRVYIALSKTNRNDEGSHLAGHICKLITCTQEGWINLLGQQLQVSKYQIVMEQAGYGNYKHPCLSGEKKEKVKGLRIKKANFRQEDICYANFCCFFSNEQFRSEGLACYRPGKRSSFIFQPSLFALFLI